jgi:hypothetical protein
MEEQQATVGGLNERVSVLTRIGQSNATAAEEITVTMIDLSRLAGDTRGPRRKPRVGRRGIGASPPRRGMSAPAWGATRWAPRMTAASDVSILVVEDSAFNRLVLRKRLAELGYPPPTEAGGMASPASRPSSAAVSTSSC